MHRMTNISAHPPASADPRYHALALVRWYAEDGRINDQLTKNGCKPVRWDRDPISGAPEYYEVINLLSVKQRVFRMPDFARCAAGQEALGPFHVSAFKWSRRPHELPPSMDDEAGNEGAE